MKRKQPEVTLIFSLSIYFSLSVQLLLILSESLFFVFYFLSFNLKKSVVTNYLLLKF